MTLLQQRDAARQQARLRLYDETRASLRIAAEEVLPHSRFILFGSLVKRGRFNDASDVDIALFEEPLDRTAWCLQADLEDRLRRPIDLVLLSQSRLRDKIVNEGELWTT